MKEIIRYYEKDGDIVLTEIEYTFDNLVRVIKELSKKILAFTEIELCIIEDEFNVYRLWIEISDGSHYASSQHHCVIEVFEINGEEESYHAHTKEFQKIKMQLKKKFLKQHVSSNLR